jgi:hypothetical protein
MTNALNKVKSEEELAISLGTKSTAVDFLLRVQLFSIPVGFLLVLLIPSYFNVVAARQMIFYGADSNCVTGGAALGFHCFGDFGGLINWLNLNDNPWDTGTVSTPYPPLNMILMDFFNSLTSMPAPGVLLGIYLFSLIVSMALPIWWASSGLKLANRIILILTLVLVTLPGIATFDRGNNLVWSLPFLYKGLVAGSKGDFKKSIFHLTIAIALRPQLIIFSLLFLVLKQYRTFAKLTASSIFVYAISFMYFAGFNILSTVKAYMNGVLGYGSGIPDTWPPNLSLARGLKSFFELMSYEIEGTSIILISNFLMLLVVLIVLFRYSKFDYTELVFVISPLIFLVSAMTWAYYGTFLFIVIAVMIAEKSPTQGLILQSKRLSYFYLICISITLSTLFLPLMENYENLVQYLVPICWVIFYTSYTFHAFRTYRFLARTENP